MDPSQQPIAGKEKPASPAYPPNPPAENLKGCPEEPGNICYSSYKLSVEKVETCGLIVPIYGLVFYYTNHVF